MVVGGGGERIHRDTVNAGTRVRALRGGVTCTIGGRIVEGSTITVQTRRWGSMDRVHGKYRPFLTITTHISFTICYILHCTVFSSSPFPSKPRTIIALNEPTIIAISFRYKSNRTCSFSDAYFNVLGKKSSVVLSYFTESTWCSAIPKTLKPTHLYVMDKLYVPCTFQSRFTPRRMRDA